MYAHYITAIAFAKLQQDSYMLTAEFLTIDEWLKGMTDRSPMFHTETWNFSASFCQNGKQNFQISVESQKVMTPRLWP